MGGAHQDVLENPETIDVGKKKKGDVLEPRKPRVSSSELPRIAPLEQAIRYHVNNGEAHFHDDDENLKVAMPVAEWWKAIEQVSNFRTELYRYVDHANGTVLELRPGVNDDGEFDVTPTVKEMPATGPLLSKLMTFADKSRGKS